MVKTQREKKEIKELTEERANKTIVRKLQLEEELKVLKRRIEEVQKELYNLDEMCPHLNLATVDYWEGGSCRIRERCNDCEAERPRGHLSEIGKNNIKRIYNARKESEK